MNIINFKEVQDYESCILKILSCIGCKVKGDD
jgi:hypothetical protein